jgi:hypothetical protein
VIPEETEAQIISRRELVLKIKEQQARERIGCCGYVLTSALAACL